jgi:hypothetical protein
MKIRIVVTTIAIAIAIAIAPVWLAAAPQAAGPDLRLTLAAPANQQVYQSGTFTYTVANIGKKTAAGAKVVITLPGTGTSPQVFVMGTLNSFSSRCSRAGLVLTCTLGSLAKNASTTVYVDLMLPYSTAPIVLSATASTTTNEPAQGNNTVIHSAALGTYPVAMTFGTPIVHRHCTGTASLTSFFECTLFPSSIAEHEATFNSNGTIDLPPGYTGSWTYTATENRLQFEYFEGAVLVAQFDGRGVGNNCFEGRTTFIPDNGYVSPYRLCF